MAVPESYLMRDAVKDLRQTNLLTGVYRATAAGWAAVADEDIDGFFHGATLDSRQATAGCLFVGLPGPRVHGRQFAGQALAAGAHVLTDALPESCPASAVGFLLVCKDPEAALACLAGCWRARLTVRVIGITGSNGKTTTKDLLAALLNSSQGVFATPGNLNSAQGVPLSLLDLTPSHRLAVIEMGASAIGHIAARAALARPEVGVITNAAGAHLAEFGDLDGVIDGKGELVAALPASGTAILNADSPGFETWCERAPCPVVSWGENAGQHRWSWEPAERVDAGWLELDGERWPVPLPGRHNAANLTAAILAARAVGVEDPVLRRGLDSFEASPHRGRLRLLAGRYLLDDSYNANPASMLAAARMLIDMAGGRAIAVLGAMAELGPDQDTLHRRCGSDLATLGIDELLVVGRDADHLARGFKAAGGRTVYCGDHATAARHLAASTERGDRILVKGSRSAAMERVIALLQQDHDWQEAIS